MSSLAEVTLSTPQGFLAQVAPMSAGGWHALGAQIYPGALSVATDNSVYRFENGVLLGRAKRSARSFECPKSMRGLRLIGFLHDEGGMWSLSPRWQAGARAVLWKPGETDAESFVLTSHALEFTRAPSQSRVMLGQGARPLSIRRPLPPSMTRIHSAPPAVLSG